MFHRVKSEVQAAEPKKEEKSQPDYRKSDSAKSSADEDRQEHVSGRYSRSSIVKNTHKQEEKTTMRPSKDSSVQGKYIRESEDASAEEETQTSGYRPSLGRGNSSYGSSYGASSYTPPQAPETNAYTGNDRVLTIGRGINMSGEIDACDHLLVEGTVEAALKGAKVLDIAESGVFYGTVEIEEATIAGRFEGDITVNGCLTLKSGGVITGSIAYRELEVESGAVLDGRMTPLKPAVDEASIDKYRAGSGASAMAKPKSLGKKDAANAENGLFSKAHAS